MTVLALYCNKGGVGKTATAVNLSYLAAMAGYKTLICDLDSQSAATFYFRVKPRLKKKAQGFAKVGKAVDNSIKGTDYENLDLLPADFSHRQLDIAFHGQKKADKQLQRILKPLRQEYDLIFLDCPPTLNVLAENVFTTADKMLIPIVPTTLSIRTHVQLLSFLSKNGYGLESVYGFFSMVDRRKKMHRELVTAVYNGFDNILKSPIPYLSQVEQMGLKREPVPAFAPGSAATTAYRMLWQEIQARVLQAAPANA